MTQEYRQALARAAESPKQDPELTKKATKKARVEEPKPIEESEEEEPAQAPAQAKANGKAKEKSVEPPPVASSKAPVSKGKGKPPAKGTAVFEVDDSTEDEEEISSTLKPQKDKAPQKPAEEKKATPTFSFAAPAPPAPVSSFIPALKSTPSPAASPSPAPEDPKSAAMAALASSLPKFDFKMDKGVKPFWPEGSEQKQALQMPMKQLPKFKLLA